LAAPNSSLLLRLSESGTKTKSRTTERNTLSVE
jgi:hypothetical protein